MNVSGEEVHYAIQTGMKFMQKKIFFMRKFSEQIILPQEEVEKNFVFYRMDELQIKKQINPIIIRQSNG